MLAGGTRIGLVVADVCDKGVGAALFMALFRSLVRAFAEREFDSSVIPGSERASSVIPSSGGARDPDAARLLSTVVSTNDYIARTHGNANMFATVFFAVLDPADGSFSWINAGHEAPIVCGASGVTARLAPSGPALGMMPGMKFEVRESRLDPGQTLLAFTDGVTEAKDASGGLYSEERLLGLVAEGAPTAPALLDRIEQAVSMHSAGAERFDDITMLAVRRAGASAEG
jgi:sigma-B regulation protein RsbU (phosphoserine phosphatase)